jgi:ribonuclease Z
LTAEAFDRAHPAGEASFDGIVYQAEGLTVEARIMDHGIPCLAYAVRERPRTNVDVAALAALGLKPGRWIQELKDPRRGDDEDVATDTGTHRLGDLRRRLLVPTPGSCLAYLTDFGLDDRAGQELREMLKGCELIVGEASYRDTDAELARRYRHFTGPEMGWLAAAVGARKLVLFHLSDRYTSDDWRELLAEVRNVFPAAGFPSHWGLD